MPVMQVIEARCASILVPHDHLRHDIRRSRDAQIILGHSRLAVTLEIYTHEDRQAQREALGKISDVLRYDDQSGQ